MKHTLKYYGLSLLAAAAAMFVALPAPAQQINGTPGSPSATTTIEGKQLPAPDPKFGGVIKDSALQSKAWWAPRIVPPKGAPNVLLIMTDDVGYGAPSTFGGVIPTPNMDRIAKAGLVIHEVPSYECDRMYGESHLHVVRDGGRVLRTIVLERVSAATWRTMLRQRRGGL